jgi:phosphoglycerol transferase MdoB-like AlkP superfamily enzyme
MHAYNKNFWNHATFEKSIGFEHQFYETSYIMTDMIGRRLRGLSDISFFSQSIDKIRALRAPFYVFLRTLSTHTPFIHFTTDIDNFPLSQLEGKIIGYYIRSMHYVDSAIGELLLKLHEHDLLSNTIVVVYGDHRARLPESELQLIGINDSDENNKIPLIIYLPDKKYVYHSDTIGGLIDIAPTICNILGVDISDKFFLGNDLASSQSSFVIFRNGSYISKDSFTDKTFAQRQLRISDLILEKDMIALMRNSENHY